MAPAHTIGTHTTSGSSAFSSGQETIGSTPRGPEEQTGASKEAMVQAEPMTQCLKEVCDASKVAYDASAALQANLRRTCELGAHYASLEKKTNQLQLDLKVEKRNTTCTQVEVKTMGETMKQALVDKDNGLAGAQKVAREKTKAAEEKLEEEKKLLKTATEDAKMEIAELKKR
uniref:Uncharacterized protein n=1 Tax=Triticum urartu TaxID=4572 RepID=A0A8R7V935_TRIUA